jgi:uncharacterized protein (TIGR03086 family)
MSDQPTSAEAPLMIDLEPVARRVAVLAEGVGDDQLGGPTPCPAYAVRNLLGHLIGLSTAFRDAGRKELGASTGTDPSSVVPDIDDEGPWRAQLPKVLDELAATWRDPGAWEGMTQAGGLTFPAVAAGRVALNELLVHGWDLARATGQPYAPDSDSLQVSYAFLAPSAEDRPADSLFGPALPTPPDATLLDQVIALSGRDPGWKP